MVGAWLLCALAATTCAASPLWHRLVPFRAIDADPDKSYTLSEQDGPWIIMAATFSGPSADQQAHDLVLELRRDYRMKAYVHDKKFDLGKDLAGRGMNRYGGRLRWQNRRGDEIREVAVMVGDFLNVDDPSAAKTLQRIKYARPQSMTAISKDEKNKDLKVLRRIQAAILPQDNEKKHRGPMGHAFLTTNPLLPREFFAPQGVDRLVESMNKGLRHSLLKCPGKYSVTVATFKGAVILKQNEIRAIEQGQKRLKSRLDEAAEKAHELTLALRRKGYDAYEFHDRYASIVTVGSFDSVGTPRLDGKIEINPKMHMIIKTFGADPAAALGAAAGVQRKRVAGIPLDIQPIPVEVPRRSIASDYTAAGLPRLGW